MSEGCYDPLCPVTNKNRAEIKTALAKAAMFDEALAIITTYRQWDDADGHAKTCVCRACCSDELIARANKLAKGETT